MNPNTHIYLYAKGHYKETNIIADLKAVIGERARMPVKFVSVDDIFSVVLPIVFDAICKSGNPPHKFQTFVRDTMGDGFINETVLYSCMSVLRLEKVEGLDLGEADESILPLSDQHKAKVAQ